MGELDSEVDFLANGVQNLGQGSSTTSSAFIDEHFDLVCVLLIIGVDNCYFQSKGPTAGSISPFHSSNCHCPIPIYIQPSNQIPTH